LAQSDVTGSEDVHLHVRGQLDAARVGFDAEPTPAAIACLDGAAAGMDKSFEVGCFLPALAFVQLATQSTETIGQDLVQIVTGQAEGRSGQGADWTSMVFGEEDARGGRACACLEDCRRQAEPVKDAAATAA
jgi:hypothetical protein